jgi:hypothetical protein
MTSGATEPTGEAYRTAVGALAELSRAQRFLAIRFAGACGFAPRRFSSASTVAGIGRQPHALACATCQATR